MRLDSKSETHTGNSGCGLEANEAAAHYRPRRKSETGYVWRGNASAGGRATQHDYEHYDSTVRLLKIPKTASGACGFRLTRSKWDPYPWVNGVDRATPANVCGLKAGDCVLEVNGEDVLGLRITEIAELVKAKSGHVTLLLWSSGWDSKCEPESLCCGPMPRSLQRLSIIVQSILSIIECPVCLDTIPPPAMQCQNGHLLCVNCRIRAEKCPVCRDRYTPRRALIAEQIYNAITSAFNLCRNEDKLRQKLFGVGLRQAVTRKAMPEDTKQQELLQPQPNAVTAVNNTKSSTAVAEVEAAVADRSVLPVARNKFLIKWWPDKACSLENLQDAHPATKTNNSPIQVATCRSNQFAEDTTNMQNHLTFVVDKVACNTAVQMPMIMPATATTKSATTNALPANNVAQVNAVSKLFSAKANDLVQQQQQPRQEEEQQQQCSIRHEQQHSASNIAATPLMTIKRCPSAWQRRSSSSLKGKSTPASSTSSQTTSTSVSPTPPLPQSFSPSSSSATSLLFLDKRRPCASLSNTIECMNRRQSSSQLPDDVVDDNDADDAGDGDTHTTMALTALPHCGSSSSSRASSLSLTSSGIFTSMESSCCSTTPIRDELSHTCNTAITPASSAVATPPTPVDTASLSVVTLETPPASASTTASTPTPTPQLYVAPVGGTQPAQPGGRYRCPCDCGSSFDASSPLQRHVKVAHGLPVLSFGAASAQFALPLRQPIDNAVLILEVHNAGSDACEAATATAADESVKSDDLVQQTDAAPGVQECWIRITTLGKECVQAAALLQATAAESANYVLETRLSGNKSIELDDAAARTVATAVGATAAATQSQNVGECENEVMEPTAAEQLQRWRQQTRSIVHSMQTTTWQQAYEQQQCATGSNSSSNSGSNQSDLQVISVIYQDTQRQQQQLPGNGCCCINTAADHYAGDLLLNIDVRRLN